MPGKSDCSPALAFKLYCEMGASRSLKGLETKLHAKGYTTSRTTLMRWAKKNGWEKSATEGDQLAQAALTLSMETNKIVDALEGIAPEAIPFTVSETCEGAANAIHRLTAAMSEVVTQEMTRYVTTGASVDLGDLVVLARVVVDLGKTAATMHTALNPPAKATAAARDENGYLPGTAPAQLGGPPGIDALIALAANPPRTRS